VQKSAGDTELKKAFRRLAKKYHPDANKNDPKLKDRFAELNAAYELLSDPDKRAAFDRGEMDAEGKPRFQGFGGFGGGREGFAGAGAQPGARTFRYSSGFGRRAAPDLNDVFSDLFSGFSSADVQEPQPKGADILVTATVPFAQAVLGGTARVTLPNGRALDVKIAAGTEDGKQIRLKGQGSPSPFGGPAGDAIVTVRVEPHPVLRSEGANLRLDLPITLDEAVLGGKARVPTLEGAVDLTIPAGSNGGRVLRLRGRGGRDAAGRRGDLLVALRIQLPDTPDPELEALMRQWRETRPYRVRGPEFD